MAYKLADLARTSPSLPGDLDRTKRRARRTLSPDRQRELLDILDREEAKNLEGVVVPSRGAGVGRARRD